MTPNESNALEALYVAGIGKSAGFGWVWIETGLDFLGAAAAPVVRSLVRSGCIETRDFPGPDACARLTEKGYATIERDFDVA